MNKEYLENKELFNKLCAQPKTIFPKNRKSLEAPLNHGVYIIRKGDKVLHIGRTLRGKEGLYQRLKNHLYGSSSFTYYFLGGKGSTLRDGQHTYQFLVLENPRKRALLEAYAIGTLCPKHLGLGD